MKTHFLFVNLQSLLSLSKPSQITSTRLSFFKRIVGCIHLKEFSPHLLCSCLISALGLNKKTGTGALKYLKQMPKPKNVPTQKLNTSAFWNKNSKYSTINPPFKFGEIIAQKERKSKWTMRVLRSYF